MAFFESRSSIGRKLAVVRWFLPLVLALLVVIYETLEHVVYVPEPIGADFVMEVGFFGFFGPVLVALGITWLMRNPVSRRIFQPSTPLAHNWGRIRA